MTISTYEPLFLEMCDTPRRAAEPMRMHVHTCTRERARAAIEGINALTTPSSETQTDDSSTIRLPPFPAH
ncbi:hypothetical protein PSPO01_10907 [Paraphaeosphaeria sporulosa]